MGIKGTRYKNIANKRYGRLVAIKSVGKNHKGTYDWLCQCDCGNKITTSVSYLINGDTRSCGCLKKELEQKHLRDEYDNKRVDGVAVHLFNDKPRKHSSTGYRGVFKYRTRVSKQLRYGAWITVNHKRYYKKGFKTAEDAYYKGRLYLEQKHLPKRSNKHD